MLERQLNEAIERKPTVTFRYREEVRAVEPHIVGLQADNELHLSAWQTSGSRPDFRALTACAGQLSPSP
jgi:hypothetical protein